MGQHKPVFRLVIVIVAFLPIKAFCVHGVGPDANSQPRYVANEIIVKFNQTAASALEIQLNDKATVTKRGLSQRLNQINKRYTVKNITPLFKDFKKNRQHIKSLRQKDKTLLSKKEKHILRRLARAPKGAKIPDLDRI